VADAARTGLDIPYDFLRKAVTESGIENGMDETTAIKRLAPRRTAILSGIYDHLVAGARQHNSVPIYVFLPQVTEGDWEEETAETLKLAAAAGFAVIDLSGIYKSQDIATIRVGENDGHPNRKGHQLVADRLYDLLGAGQLFAPRPVR
jgi:lysophospholipase L1-like esterase